MDVSNSRSISNIFNEIRRFSASLLRRFSGRTSAQLETLKIPLTSKCTYKLVMKGSENDLTVMFFICGMDDHVLSSSKRDHDLWAEKINHHDTKLWERCSFYPVASLWFDGFCAFESVTESSKFIVRGDNGMLELRKYDGTKNFKEKASFVFRKIKRNGNDSMSFENRRRAFSTNTPPSNDLLKVNKNEMRKLSLHNKSDIIEEIIDFDSRQIGRIYQNRHTSAFPFYDYYSIDYQQCEQCFSLKSIGPVAIQNSYLTLSNSSRTTNLSSLSGTVTQIDE